MKKDLFTASNREAAELIESSKRYQKEITAKFSVPRSTFKRTELTDEQKEQNRQKAKETQQRNRIIQLADDCTALYYLYLLNEDAFLNSIKAVVRKESRNAFNSFTFCLDFLDGKDLLHKDSKEDDLAVDIANSNEDLRSKVQVYIKPENENNVYTFIIHFHNWRYSHREGKPLNFTLQSNYSCSNIKQTDYSNLEDLLFFDGNTYKI